MAFKNTIQSNIFRSVIASIILFVFAMGCSASRLGIASQTPTALALEPSRVILEYTVTPNPSNTKVPAQTTVPVDIEDPTTPYPVEYDAESIYFREIYRGQVFESPEHWIEKFDEWSEIRPDHPGIVNAAKGLAAALRARRAFEGDSEDHNDKWQHCLLGAEIGSSVSFEAASFTAWLKEFQDLTDGRPSTGFDEVDYEATLDGALQSVSEKCEDCAEVCATRWGRGNAKWNRARPDKVER